MWQESDQLTVVCDKEDKERCSLSMVEAIQVPRSSEEQCKNLDYELWTGLWTGF